MGVNTYESDILVIGGGIAGLFAAITARQTGASVVLTDKAYAGKSGASIMASGQLNVFNPDWGVTEEEAYLRTLKNGEYLNHRNWLRVMIRESWGVYENMRDWGVEFPCPESEFPTFMGKLHGFIRADGEPEVNITPIEKPAFGMIPLKHREVPVKLRKYAEKQGVKFADRTMITEILTENGTVCGAVGFSADSGEGTVFRAKAVIMAAGKNCFRASGMNVAELTGDADAMAYRAGADISGKEFPDMHTGLARHTAWKGTGEIYPAYWCYADCNGDYAHGGGYDLSCAMKIHQGKGPMMWDFENMTKADEERIERYLDKRDMRHEGERIDIGYLHRKNEQLTGGATAGSPAEHSSGIFPVDMDCASTLPGLFAAGDCCCSWAWGAVGGGAPPGILSAAVTGKHAGAGAVKFAQSHPLLVPEADGALKAAYAPLERKGGFDPRWVCQLLQGVMIPYYVINIKHGDRLRAALVNVEFFRDHMVPMLKAGDLHELRLCHEVRNMVLNAEMILRASLAREESRGWHYREDFPERDDEKGLMWVLMRRGDGGMETEKRPLPREWNDEIPRENAYDVPNWQV